MLDNTWPKYLFIRTVIFFLQWLGPACLAYTAWTISNTWPEVPTINAISTWCAAESVFFLFFLWYRVHLQRDAIHPPLRSRQDREALFARVRSEIHDPDRFLGGWFRGADIQHIGREEVKAYLDWTCWDGRAQRGPNGADEEELEYYTVKVEEMMRKSFSPGYGTAKSLRLTLDPIVMECRTLFWYFLMGLLDTITHCLMRFYGFQYFKTTATSLWTWPPRPATWIEPECSPTSGISYWLRPHTSTKRLPILYLHGIGVGLIAHVQLLAELDTALNSDDPADGEVGMLVLEIPQISSRLTHAILGREQFLQQLTDILNFYNYNRFVLASHSYGSVLSTHILTHTPLASRVTAALLVDPVTVLLHMPDVAYNFTVRPPKRANEWLLSYFASRDPGVAHTLGRHFFWSENILWRDRIMELVQDGTRITTSLASQDLIVDTKAVGAYLTEHQVLDPVIKEDTDGRIQMALQAPYSNADHWKQRRWRGVGLEVMWWEGLDHGEVYDRQDRRARLVDVLVEYCRGV